MRILELEFTGASTALPPIQTFPSIAASQQLSPPQLPGLSLHGTSPDLLAFSSEWMNPTPETAVETQSDLCKPGVLLEPELPGAPHNARISDKFFNPSGTGIRLSNTWPLTQQAHLVDPLLLDGSQENGSKGKSAQVRAATFPRPIAINPNTPQRAYTSEFNASSKQMRPKARGRFTASRRKEVQEVRKLGACIRCRMLKKSVGDESNMLSGHLLTIWLVLRRGSMQYMS